MKFARANDSGDSPSSDGLRLLQMAHGGFFVDVCAASARRSALERSSPGARNRAAACGVGRALIRQLVNFVMGMRRGAEFHLSTRRLKTSSNVAATRKTPSTPTTEAVASTFFRDGRIMQFFCNTLPTQLGFDRALCTRWIASTTKATTSRATSAGRPPRNRPAIAAKSGCCASSPMTNSSENWCEGMLYA